MSEGRGTYFPVHESLFEGSLMVEPIPTRWLMIVLIWLASRPNANGLVDVPIPRLAQLANMTETELRSALAALMGPDADSGSSEEEGRRVIPVNSARPERGWRLVNFQRYREAMHRANEASRKRRERMPGRERTNPDASENGDKKREDTKRGTTSGGGASERRAAPPLSEILEFAKANGIPEASAVSFQRHHAGRGWRGVVDWKPLLEKWGAEDAERAQGPRRTERGILTGQSVLYGKPREPREVGPDAPAWVRRLWERQERGERLSHERPPDGIPEDSALAQWRNGIDFDEDPTGTKGAA